MKPCLIVDGYNVIGAWREADKMSWSIDESRDRLIRMLEDYAGYSGEDIVVVFDGYQSDKRFSTELHENGITVVYTKRGETADSYIERYAAQLPKYVHVRVATSDGLEQSQVLSTGAVRMTSRELLRELKDIRRTSLEAHQRQTVQKSDIASGLPSDILAKLEKIRRSRR